MWAIFMLSALGFGLVALLLIYFGNKIINQMKKDNFKTEKELERKKEETKGENE